MNAKFGGEVTCDHCGAKYATTHDYIEDCFVDSDGWSWDYFHKCLSDKGIEIHGYKPNEGERKPGLK